MKTKDAIDYFQKEESKGAKGLADTLGISVAAIYQWGEYPPLGRQYQIEALSKGALRTSQSLEKN